MDGLGSGEGGERGSCKIITEAKRKARKKRDG